MKEIKIIPWRDAGRCALLFPLRFSNRQVDDDAVHLHTSSARSGLPIRSALLSPVAIWRRDHFFSFLSDAFNLAILLTSSSLFYSIFFILANINTITQIRFRSYPTKRKIAAPFKTDHAGETMQPPDGHQPSHRPGIFYLKVLLDNPYIFPLGNNWQVHYYKCRIYYHVEVYYFIPISSSLSLSISLSISIF